MLTIPELMSDDRLKKQPVVAVIGRDVIFTMPACVKIGTSKFGDRHPFLTLTPVKARELADSLREHADRIAQANGVTR